MRNQDQFETIGNIVGGFAFAGGVRLMQGIEEAEAAGIRARSARNTKAAQERIRAAHGNDQVEIAQAQARARVRIALALRNAA